MGKKDTPQAPDSAKSYQQGIDVYLKNNPELLAAEQAARTLYDPQRIQESQALQDQFGDNQYAQQLKALHTLDPAGAVIRDQLAGNVSQDLANGRNLAPDQIAAFQNDVRARQASTGNVNGSAPISAEAAIGAQARENQYQLALGNAGQFLGLPTPEQQILAVQPVTPDRSSAYVDPNAGFQGQNFALNNYQNLLAQTQASGGSSPWSRALGAVAGAAGGYATTGSPWGAVAGGVAGGVGGGWG